MWNPIFAIRYPSSWRDVNMWMFNVNWKVTKFSTQQKLFVAAIKLHKLMFQLIVTDFIIFSSFYFQSEHQSLYLQRPHSLHHCCCPVQISLIFTSSILRKNENNFHCSLLSIHLEKYVWDNKIHPWLLLSLSIGGKFIFLLYFSNFWSDSWFIINLKH